MSEPTTDQLTLDVDGEVTPSVTVARQRLSVVREAEVGNLPDGPLCHPVAVARFFRLLWRDEAQEVMGAVFLDGRNCPIGYAELHRGTINRAAVEPRYALTHALLTNASGLILAHCHPSGSATPSAEDIAFTRRLAEAGEIVGVHLYDHLVIGCGTHKWTSLARAGEC